ncbi:DUF6296 family protein [Kitasatospora sp. NPDC050543]|uniref:DUF6296 family protein n=1 Tax=Kitasatospora sp. NPDC050543 TaxID=3364054 RepID=UPI00379930A3
MHHDCYELAFDTSSAANGPAVPDLVLVQREPGLGPGGHPLYRDRTGIFCAEISDRGEVRMFVTGAHQRPLRPSSVRRGAADARP